ncbi:MAG: beta strand repeat-containing protein, partial [Gemmataceae bacterium]
ASSFLSAYGGAGAVGGAGGAGGVGGAAQGGGFYSAGGALSISNSQFTHESLTSGSGGSGGNGNDGGVGGKSGKKSTAQNFIFGGPGGNGGPGGDGGNAGYADGGGGTNAGGNATITGVKFTNDVVQAGNGGNGGNAGNGGQGGDANVNTIISSGSGGQGGLGGRGGSGSSAQGGGLSVTGGTLTINNSAFGGAASLADEVLGGNGGNGGNGGVQNISGAPQHAYSFPSKPPTPNGGNGGQGGAGTAVSGGGLAVSPGVKPNAVGVINDFVGIDTNNSSDSTPPDTQGAAGKTEYVETVNSALAIYNKASGQQVALDSQYDFFFTQGGITPANPNFPFLSDSFTLYIPQIDRFLVGVLDINFSGPSQIDLAMSKTDAPGSLTAKDWNFFTFSTGIAPGDANAFADYPGNVGYNDGAVVITLNMFAATNHVQVDAININALTSGQGLVEGTNFYQTDTSGFSLRPATMKDSSNANDPMWMVGEGGDNKSIKVVEMTNVLSANPTFTTTTLAVNPYTLAVNPLQPDGSPITFNGYIDSRIMNVDEQTVNGKTLLVAAQSVSNVGGTLDNARWYEIDATGKPVLAQQGDVGGGPGVYDAYPGIAINSKGTIGMSFVQSGTSSGQFMSVYVTGRLASDPSGFMNKPVDVQVGVVDANILTAREGDMSGINVDPTDGSFWIANEYANTETPFDWGTAIAHFTVLPVVVPPRTVTLNNSSSDYNVLVGGNGGDGGQGGSLPGYNLSVTGFIPVGGDNGDGGGGGNASGGGVFLSSANAITVDTAAMYGMDISSNSADGGKGGGGAILAKSISGSGGAGGSVLGVGMGSIDYKLTAASYTNPTTNAQVASKFSGNIGEGGQGGDGGSQSLQIPNTGAGGSGGTGGSVLGGGIAFLNNFATTLTFNVTGASASSNVLTGAEGGLGGEAGNWGHDHIIGGSGGAGGQALGGGFYIYASPVSANVAAVNSTSMNYNDLVGGTGNQGGDGSSATSGANAGTYAAGGAGGNAEGGGLYDNSLNGTTADSLTISASTMAGNDLEGGNGGIGGTGTTANGGPGGNGGVGGNADGGGFYAGNSSTVTVVNTTIGGITPSSKAATFNSNILVAGNAGAGSDAGTPQGSNGVPFADGGNGGDAGNARGAGAYFNNGMLLAPTAPGLGTASSGGSWTAQKAWVLITYVNANGETIGSAVSSIAVGANGILTIDSPSPEGNGAGAATGWYAYVGVGSTQPANTAMYRQQAAGTPTAIGANLVLTANPTTTGVNPPTSNTANVGVTTFINDTIVNNQAGKPGLSGAPGSGAGSGGAAGTVGAAGVSSGGGYYAGGSANQVGNTILDLNSAVTTGADVVGTFTSLGYNILGATTGATGPNSFSTSLKDQIGVTATQLNIGPLLNNGGLTPTDALLNNSTGKSVAIDAGGNTLVTNSANPWYNLFGSPPTDQRGPGFNRIVNGIVDVGAVELTNPTISGLSATATAEGSKNVVLTISGTGFQAGATVNYGGTTLTPLTITGSTITVAIPGTLPGDETPPIDVSVGNPDGSGLLPGPNGQNTLSSNTKQFTITEGASFSLVPPGNQTNDVNDTPTLTIAPASPDNLPDAGVNGFTDVVNGQHTLPPGLSIDPKTGQILGTISVNAASSSPQTYQVTITAYDGTVSPANAATVTFNWVVKPFTLAQPANQTNNEGDSVTLKILSSTGSVASNYSATGLLPLGLTINSTTGVISGTINPNAVTNGNASQNFSVTITAGSSGATASTTFIWTVNDTTAPALTNPGNQANLIGDTLSSTNGTALQIQATDADSFSATGLPPGLSISSTGLITGTITGNSSNTYAVTITATDSGVSSTVSFVWAITIPFGLINPEPVNGQNVPVPLQNNESDAVSLQMAPVSGYTANNYSASGLPTGLSINPSTGLISGTIDSRGAGAYTVTVKANDSQGTSASVTFYWNVSDTTPPVLTNPGLQTSGAGQNIPHFAILAEDADPGSFVATGLPKGLSIDANG